ncbi:MAG: R3H domain-containing nucleic acid-binding protein [Patescibacteria group bacterium]
MPADSLKSFVESLLLRIGCEFESVEVKGTHRTTVAVRSNDGKSLIGQGGEHLRALNTVARRMVEHMHGEDAANFFIDVNEYREAELERVRQNARMLAQRARLFKHDVELPPQSAYERLVVHELFAEDPEIATESTGEGKFRRIVLKYKTTA